MIHAGQIFAAQMLLSCGASVMIDFFFDDGSIDIVGSKALRNLRDWPQWGIGDLEAAAALARGTGSALVKALQTEGLIEASGSGAWIVTQAGRTFAQATAAKPVTRATAERAFAPTADAGARIEAPGDRDSRRGDAGHHSFSGAGRGGAGADPVSSVTRRRTA